MTRSARPYAPTQHHSARSTIAAGVEAAGPRLTLVALCLPPRSRCRRTRTTRKQVRAVRPAHVISLDGRLDERHGHRRCGSATSCRKSARRRAAQRQHAHPILYDDDAIYVGARMFSRDPSKIQAPLSRRDNTFSRNACGCRSTATTQATAYSFGYLGIGGAGGDWVPCVRHENDANFGFDPVWERRRTSTARLDLGDAHPFSQLRFTNQRCRCGAQRQPVESRPRARTTTGSLSHRPAPDGRRSWDQLVASRASSRPAGSK